MSDRCGCNTSGNETLSGVMCDVKHCKHHTQDGHCSARSIKVENSTAMRVSETCCSTFMPC